MRIGIDVSPLYMSVSGISNYVRHLLRGFASAGGDYEYMLYSNRAFEPDPVLSDRFTRRLVRLPFPRFQMWFQAGLPFRLLRDDVDVFLGAFHRLPLASPVPSVLTVHDLSGMVHREHHERTVILRNRLLPAFIKRASRIIAVSDFTRREVIRLFPAAEGKVDVILEAPAEEFYPVTEPEELSRVKLDLGLPDRFILFLGTLEPRKNLPRLVEAFSSVAHRMPQDLVLAGRMGWDSGPLRGVLERTDIAERIHITGFVPQADLPALLSMAEMVVYPSLYEGFGLPVVEAMACGAPVLTSSVSSLPETAGGAALLADPESTSDMAEKLLEMSGDVGLRSELTARGYRRVRQLSWEKTARETLESCERALEKGGS